MSVSYANIVAGSTTTPEPVLSSDIPEKKSSAEETKEESKDETTHLPSPTESPKAPAKISLAPAPVPHVNAWGSADSSRSNSNVSQVDTKHWPSPLETPQSPLQNGKKINMVKTSKEKWVPFKAAVVLTQPLKKASPPKKTQKGSNVLASANKQGTTDAKKRKSKSEKRPQQQKQPKEHTSEESTESKDDHTLTSTASPEQPQQHQHNPNNQHYYPQQFPQGQKPFRPFNNRRYNKTHGQPNYNSYPPQFQNSPGFYYTPRSPFGKQNEPTYSLTKQIEYYFSVENLAKDLFLRKHMNDDGWLLLEVIASFYRMQVLSGSDIEVIKAVMYQLNGGLIEMGQVGDSVVIRVRESYKTWVLAADQRLDKATMVGEVTLIPSVEQK